jgi:hypothetical protein
MNNRKIFGLALLLLLMAAAGGLWAQELKFDGYLNSGLGVVVTDKEGEDAYIKAFGVDSESNGYRFRLNGSYTNEAKNAGARLRLQSQRRADRGGLFSLPYAYGWVGFFDSKLTLTGGLVMDGTWETVDWYWIDDQGEGLGLLLKAEPVKGLNLGIGAYAISQQSGGSNNILSIGNSSSTGYNLPNFGDIKLKPEDAKYTFNAAYTMPDTFRLGVSFRTKNRAAWTGVTAADINNDGYGYSGREESSQLIGEFRLLAVKGLTAVVVGVLDNLDEFSDKGNIFLSETFGYKVNDDLNLGFNAAQFLYNRVDANDDKVDADPGLLFNLWGSYAFGSVVPRLDLVYFLGGQSKTAQWERRGFEAQGGLPGGPTGNYGRKDNDEDDNSVFSVRPSVKINVDSRTFLEIGDIINLDSSTKEGAYADKDDAKKSTLLTNVFYVDVKFSF